MKGYPIRERHHSEMTAELGYKDPVADSAIVRLNLAPNRVRQRIKAPLQIDVRPLNPHIIPKIIGHRRVRHRSAVFPFHDSKPCAFKITVPRLPSS
ncbi:MAG: hypothetical protein P8Y25_08870 [Chromatiaceae bacterium]